MKKVFFLFLVLHFSFSYAQESGVIQGKILDGELFNEPLLMASVSIKNTSLTTQTNFRGNFEFDAVTPGTYQVMVQFLGYEAIEIPVTVKAGEKIEILETLQGKRLSLPTATAVSTVENTSPFTAVKSTLNRK